MKLLSLVLCLAGLLMAEDRPKVTNAKFESRVAAGDLAAQLKSDSPAWFGYVIKTAYHRGSNWCEGDHRETVHLEGSDTASVLLRVEKNEVTEVKLYSIDCTLDAGGLPFIWLRDVSESASLAYLRGHLRDNTIFIISQHAGQAATDILIEEAKNNKSGHMRGQALFWLAQRAGEKSAATIQNAILNDPDTEVKKKAVFALSQLPHDEGVPKLIEVARTQRNGEVRKQAFFWLGQSHDPRALQYIEDVLTH